MPTEKLKLMRGNFTLTWEELISNQHWQSQHAIIETMREGRVT